MHILHCSDIHGNETWLRWIVGESAKYHGVVIAGDLLNADAKASHEEQHALVASYLRKLRVPLMLCTGNHDLSEDEIAETRAGWIQSLRSSTILADGDQMSLSGFTFRSIGWLESPPLVGSSKEVWVVHSPPDQCATSQTSNGQDFGDFELGERCRANEGPLLALGGHVHDRVRWAARIGATTSVNAGCAPSDSIPRHVRVDLTNGLLAFGSERKKF